MLFEIPPVAPTAFVALAGLTVLAACIPWWWVRRDGVAATVKKSALIALAVLPVSVGLSYAITQNELVLSGKTLTGQAEFFYEYSRSVEEFDLEKAQLGPYESIPQAQLKWRTNGISLPGVRAGHFSTTSGAKVFAIVTDKSRVLYLPAKAGESLLVSLRDPAGVLSSLRAQQAQSTR